MLQGSKIDTQGEGGDDVLLFHAVGCELYPKIKSEGLKYFRQGCKSLQRRATPIKKSEGLA